MALPSFPSSLACILVEGHNQAVSRNTVFLGGTKTAPTVKHKITMTVLLTSLSDANDFAYWWVNEIDYGLGAFTVNMPYMGITRDWEMKVPVDVATDLSMGADNRKMNLTVAMQEDMTDFLPDTHYGLEFPYDMNCILLDGYTEKTAKRTRVIGDNVQILGNEHVTAKVFIESHDMLSKFAGWYVNELEYGTKAFKITLPFMGKTANWFVKFTTDLTQTLVNSATTGEMAFELELLDYEPSEHIDDILYEALTYIQIDGANYLENQGWNRPEDNAEVFASNWLDLTAESANANLPINHTLRRSTTATYRTNGVIKTAEIDESRYEDGLGLVEERATNYILDSGDIDGDASGWVNNRTTTETGFFAPDGSNNGVKLLADVDATETSYYIRSLNLIVPDTVPNNTTMIQSVYVKAGNTDYVAMSCVTRDVVQDFMYYQFSTDTLVAGGTNAPSYSEILDDGWVRISIEIDIGIVGASVYSGQLRVFVIEGLNTNYISDGTNYVYTWGGQIEVGVVATSYIPTTTDSVLRAEDRVDFNTLDSFVRESNATYNDSGVLKYVSANEPRYELDGLLVEEESTNVLLSSAFPNLSPDFNKNRMETIVTDGTLAPDGVTEVEFFAPNTEDDYHNVTHNFVDDDASIERTFSAYLKYDGGTFYTMRIRMYDAGGANISINFDFNTATWEVNDLDALSTITEITMEEMDDGWYRCSITGKLREVNTTDACLVRFVFLNVDDPTFIGDGSGWYIWGTQLEEGGLTSYIPTEDETVTREEDVATERVTSYISSNDYLLRHITGSGDGSENITYPLTRTSQSYFTTDVPVTDGDRSLLDRNPNLVYEVYYGSTTTGLSFTASNIKHLCSLTEGLLGGSVLQNLTDGHTPSNLALYSEDWSDATWTKTGDITATADQTTAPDGTETADLITFGAIASNRIMQQFTNIDDVTVFSVYLKAGTADQVNMRINEQTTWVQVSITFDFSEGTIYSPSGTGDKVPYNYGFEKLEDGWYRVYIAGNFAGVEYETKKIYFQCPDSTEYNKTFYAWGSQYEVGAVPTEYTPTTDTQVVGTPKWYTPINGYISGVRLNNQSNGVDNTRLVTDASGMITGISQYIEGKGDDRYLTLPLSPAVDYPFIKNIVKIEGDKDEVIITFEDGTIDYMPLQKLFKAELFATSTLDCDAYINETKYALAPLGDNIINPRIEAILDCNGLIITVEDEFGAVALGDGVNNPLIEAILAIDATVTTSGVSVTGWVIPNSSREINYNSGEQWLNIVKIETDNIDDYTLADPSRNQETYYLNGYDYDFASLIPSDATIVGIEVQVHHKGESNNIDDEVVRLFDGTSPVGDNKGLDNSIGTAWVEDTYGADDDVWNAGLTTSEIRSINFGAAVVYTNSSTPAGNDWVQVNTIRIKVYYTEA